MSLIKLPIGQIIKDHQLIIAACILSTAIVSYGQTQKFQLMQLSEGRFFQVNKYTGKIIRICKLDPAYCYEWDGLNIKSENDYYDAYLKKRREEEGLPDKD